MLVKLQLGDCQMTMNEQTTQQLTAPNQRRKLSLKYPRYKPSNLASGKTRTHEFLSHY